MEQELVGVKSQYLALRAIVNKLGSEEVIQTGTTHGIGRHSCVMDKVMRWRWKLEEGSSIRQNILPRRSLLLKNQKKMLPRRQLSIKFSLSHISTSSFPFIIKAKTPQQRLYLLD